MNICILIFLCFSWACSYSTQDKFTLQEGFEFEYDLCQEDAQLILSKKLREISGLSYYNDSLLAAIQDEKGKIYLINSNDGKIDRIIDFEDKADFEGIEMVKNHLWAIKSKGDLFRIKDLDERNVKTKKYETKLRSNNNTEALAYDEKNHRLLIGCKASPNLKSTSLEGVKAIYAFDIKAKELINEPAYLIHNEDIDALLDLNEFQLQVAKMMRNMGSDVSNFTFNISGIAIHPLSGDLYIISAKPGMILVMGSDGEYKYLATLPKSKFHQIEGICFNPAGDLYISSEGGKYGKGTILKFKIKLGK